MTRNFAAPFSHAAARLAAIAMLACGQAALAGSPISERAPADSTGHVEISNTAGSVEVSGWAGNEVEVTGTLGDGVERLEFVQNGKHTRVKVVLPSRTSRVESTSLVVKMPAASSLFVNTVSADVRSQGVRGAQRLQSVSGDIATEAGVEDVECKTVSGNVVVNGTGKKALLTVTTVSGDATMSRVGGEVNIHSVITRSYSR